LPKYTDYGAGEKTTHAEPKKNGQQGAQLTDPARILFEGPLN
jgi:hypothetical protein